MAEVVWGLILFIVAGAARDPVAAAAGIVLLVLGERHSLRGPAVALLALAALLFFLHGYASSRSYEEKVRKVEALSTYSGRDRIVLEGYVASFPSFGRGGARFVLRTTIDSTPCDIEVRVPLFTVGYGESLAVEGALAPPAPRSEGSFRSRNLCGVLRAGSGAVGRLPARAGDPVSRTLFWPLHERIRRTLARNLGTRSGLSLALLLGDRSSMSPAIRRRLSDLGIIHLFALSGLHLGIIVAFLYLCLGRARIVWMLVVPVLACVYVRTVGALVSLHRAYTMLLLAVIARSVERRMDPLQILGGTLFLIVLFDPLAVHSIALQLSFAATFGIIAATRSLHLFERRSTGAAGRIVRILLVGTAAQIFTLPLLLGNFGKASPIAPVATLVFLPATAVLLLASALACLVQCIPGPASRILFSMCGALSELFERALFFSDAHSPEPLALGSPDPYLYYSGFLIFLFTGKRLLFKLIGVGMVAASFLFPVLSSSRTLEAVLVRIIR